MSNVSNLFLRLAICWFVAGIALGIVMGASGDHSLFPVHAHINLLGWVSMTLFAVVYRLWPAAAATRLARAHFWLYVPAHFVMMVALFILYRGVPAMEPVLGVMSVIVGLGVVCFAVNVWMHTGVAANTTAQPRPASA